jgi:ankyrin repeat protein
MLVDEIIGKDGNIEIIKLLIDAGLDVNSVNEYGKSLINIAILNDNIELVKLLIEAGVDVNAVDSNGYCPLFYAIQNHYGHIIKLLIESGAHTNININVTLDSVNSVPVIQMVTG